MSPALRDWFDIQGRLSIERLATIDLHLARAMAACFCPSDLACWSLPGGCISSCRHGSIINVSMNLMLRPAARGILNLEEV